MTGAKGQADKKQVKVVSKTTNTTKESGSWKHIK